MTVYIKYSNITPQRSLEVWKKNHDLTGRTFEKLKVIKFIKFKKTKYKRKALYLCKCSCGGSKLVLGSSLAVGNVKSCGCIVKRKYKIDEKYFEKVNREDKAYFLGLIITDGNVDTKNKRFRISLSLHNKDKHILETFKKYLKTDKPLLKHLSKTKYYGKVKIKASLRWALFIGVVKMVKDIVKLGIVPKKSYISKFPTNKVVPHKLMRHFIRGVFDGDGTVHRGFYGGTITRKLQITSGSIAFLKSMQKYLFKYKIFNTSITLYSRKVEATGTRVRYGVFQVNPSIKKGYRGFRSGSKRSKKTGRFYAIATSKQALNLKKFFKILYYKCSKDLYLKRKYLNFKRTIS